MTATLAEIRSVLDGFAQDGAVYQDLSSSLSSLDQTLQNLERLSRELADKPSSLLFSPAPAQDAAPAESRSRTAWTRPAKCCSRARRPSS